MASDGHLDGLSDRLSGQLPISTSSPPLGSDIDLPDPSELGQLEIVPAAQASVFSEAQVVGTVVNLRAGPGLSYRMVDVAEQGDRLWIEGEWVGRWAPVVTSETGLAAWVHGDYIAIIE
ncbi:MAG: SH3 domain-containing protein [Pikeienuella sp.]